MPKITKTRKRKESLRYGTRAKVEYANGGKKAMCWVKILSKRVADPDAYWDFEAYIVRPLDRSKIEKELPGISKHFEKVNGGIWMARRCDMKEFRTRLGPSPNEPAIKEAWEANLADWLRVYNKKVCMDLIWAHELTQERMNAVKDYLLVHPAASIEDAVDVVIDGHNQPWSWVGFD